MRYAGTLAAGALAVATLVALGSIAACAPGRSPVPAAAPAAAADPKLLPPFVLPDLAGRQVASDSFRGRPLLVNFWATWCGPCRAELADLQALSSESAGCLAVVGVAVSSGSADEVARFVRDHEVSYPILLADRRVVADYGVGDIPRSVLLDGDGREVAHWVGVISRQTVRAAVRAISPAALRC